MSTTNKFNLRADDPYLHCGGAFILEEVISDDGSRALHLFAEWGGDYDDYLIVTIDTLHLTIGDLYAAELRYKYQFGVYEQEFDGEVEFRKWYVERTFGPIYNNTDFRTTRQQRHN